MMQIALITDLHTGQEEDYPFDINLRENFRNILEEVAKCKPDHLIVAGDLCLRAAEPDTYLWQKDLLQALHIPYHIIAGNHDDSVILQQVFNHLPLPKDGELYYKVYIGAQPFLFLDTSKKETSHTQKAWLENELKHGSPVPIVVMHHPPALMQVPYMDRNHALNDRDEIMNILQQVQKPIDVFCGHYHVEKLVCFGSIRIHITPSCYFQIDQKQQDFAVDHHCIAYRIIQLDDPSFMATHVHYLDGVKISD